MVALAEILDHEGEAHDLLITQFKGKPTIQALLDSWIEQVQLLEAVLFDLLEEREIDTAIGEQLDNLGTIVGEARNGRTDTDYRLAIRTRVLINLSSGTPEQIITIMVATLAVAVKLREDFPAAFVITAEAPVAPGIGATAGNILRQARGAAIEAILEYSEASFATTFTMGTTPMVTDASLGFGDSSNPSTGGFFAGAVEG